MQNPMWLRKLCTTKSAQLLTSQLPPKEAELPGQDVSVSASFPSFSAVVCYQFHDVVEGKDKRTTTTPYFPIPASLSIPVSGS